MASAASARSPSLSGADAQSTSWAERSIRPAAASRCRRPFWRVIRPTNNTYGRSGSTPWRTRASVARFGAYSSVSTPLRITVTRSGSTAGYACNTSSRIAADTAITVSAASIAVRSQKLDSA